MKCREYIDAIVEKGGDMGELAQLLCDCISLLDDDDYSEMCERLYILAYGEKLTTEKAHEAVSRMKPYGEHWTLEQTTNAGSNSGFERYSKNTWYWAMNMVYNDYHSIYGDETSSYVKMAKCFLIDEDGPRPDAKAYRYVMAMK